MLLGQVFEAKKAPYLAHIFNPFLPPPLFPKSLLRICGRHTDQIDPLRQQEAAGRQHCQGASRRRGESGDQAVRGLLGLFEGGPQTRAGPDRGCQQRCGEYILQKMRERGKRMERIVGC